MFKGILEIQPSREKNKETREVPWSQPKEGKSICLATSSNCGHLAFVIIRSWVTFLTCEICLLHRTLFKDES